MDSLKFRFAFSVSPFRTPFSIFFFEMYVRKQHKISTDTSLQHEKHLLFAFTISNKKIIIGA